MLSFDLGLPLRLQTVWILFLRSSATGCRDGIRDEFTYFMELHILRCRVTQFRKQNVVDSRYVITCLVYR